jgi:hypothetical protein
MDFAVSLNFLELVLQDANFCLKKLAFAFHSGQGDTLEVLFASFSKISILCLLYLSESKTIYCHSWFVQGFSLLSSWRKCE